jgi:5-methylcytosine-specific restriction protein A
MTRMLRCAKCGWLTSRGSVGDVIPADAPCPKCGGELRLRPRRKFFSDTVRGKRQRGGETPTPPPEEKILSSSPLRTCARCKRIVPPGPCQRCTQQRDQARGSAAARGYDEQWANYSRAWLARYPWCGQRVDGTIYPEHSRCAQQLTRTRAEVTDHIVAIKAGGSRLDPANHQSLCGACNRRKGIALEGGFGR